MIIQLPPFHRGVAGVLSLSSRASYLARGSRSFLSIPYRKGLKLFFSLLFVYDIKEEAEVYLVTDRNNKVLPFKIFVQSTFPYLSLRSSPRTYKSLNIFISFLSSRDSGKIEVKKDSLSETHTLFEFVVTDKNIPQKPIKKIEEAILNTPRGKISNLHLANLEASIRQSSEPKHVVEKALVLFYSKFLLNHRLARILLKRWLAFAANEHLTEEAKEFQETLEDITSPLALGPHGYNPSFKKLDLNSIEHELHELIADFAKQNVTPFLNSGTLLGYYRDGSPIPHDDDFDIGILVSGTTIDQVAKNWKDFLGWLELNYPTTIKGSFAATYLSNNVQVDVFPAWIIGEKVCVYPYCYEDVSENALTPISSLEIRGRTFPIPAKPEEVLSINYGPNWRVPDPFWRFDYSVSRKRFATVLKKLKS